MLESWGIRLGSEAGYLRSVARVLGAEALVLGADAGIEADAGMEVLGAETGGWGPTA